MSRSAPPLLALSYLAFVSLGLPDTVLGVAWPSLRQTFGLPQSALGAVLVASVSGYALSGALAGRSAAALGLGGLLAASSGLVTFGLIGYALAPSFALFAPMGFVIGMGSGAIDASLNSHAARHFPASHLNWLHACYSLGATAGPVGMTAVLAGGASHRVGYGLLAAALGAMTAAFVITRHAWSERRSPAASAAAGAAAATPALAPVPPAAADSSPGVEAEPSPALRRRRTWLQVVMFFVYTGVEAGTGTWCFTYLTEARGLAVASAGAWVSAYWASLFVGRVLLGFVVARVGPDRLLRLATLGALLGTVAFAVIPGTPGQLGLVVLGASLAPMFPTWMSRTPARLGHAAATRAIGLQVSAATIGSAVLPSAFGLVAARAGLSAFGAALVAATALLLALHEALLRAGAIRPAAVRAG